MQEQPPQNTGKKSTTQPQNTRKPAKPPPIKRQAGVALFSEPVGLQFMYSIMAVASILMIAPIGNFSLLSLLLFVAVLLVCYRRSKPERHTAFFEHYRWIIRTFWIGIFCYMPVASMSIMFLILKFSDMSHFADFAALQENPEVFEKNFNDYVADHKIMMFSIAAVLWGGAFLWWFARLWKGFRGVLAGPDFRFRSVTTWLL